MKHYIRLFDFQLIMYNSSKLLMGDRGNCNVFRPLDMSFRGSS